MTAPQSAPVVLSEEERAQLDKALRTAWRDEYSHASVVDGLAPAITSIIAARLSTVEAERDQMNEALRMEAQNAADAECDRDKAEAALATVTDQRDKALAQLERVTALADQWTYKGEFGWGSWQEGEGPDFESQVLDTAATRLRDMLAADSEDE